ncbi:restriction endonuclease subunit S [Chromobacterium phragmitis]|uniref:Restriction endonuclease subunit S n=1 Tax=Chromobacterium phragmitis TaxID=2202141 RepID=A0ABV0IN51_9NEIS
MSSEDVLSSPLDFPDSWRLVKLKSITQKIGSGATPKGGQAAYQERRTNFALVRSQNVFDREFSESGLAFISDSQAETLKGVKLEENDILLNITGDGVTFGRACLIPSKVLPACVNQHVSIIRLNENFAVPGYVVSYLTHPTIKRYIESFNAGGSRRAITKAHIESFVIPLPPLEIQNKIAQLLGAFDDRITLLRETNSTLEAIAQALFKSWFVDFDPVRAKMEGRAPEGMDEATAALFPDEFEESAQGLVPRGWGVDTLASLFRLHKGSVNPGARPEVEFQHFSLPAFDAGQMPVLERGDAIKSNKTTIPENAVLLSKLNPHIPRVWLPSSVGENAVCSTEFLPFVPTGPSTTAFIYSLLTTSDFIQLLCQLVTGTSNSHQRVKPDSVLSLPCVVPPSEVVSAFDAIVNRLLNRLKANREQAQTLASLRDTLLPRLISGQLRLPEAEALIA